jgi:hypothetical protein
VRKVVDAALHPATKIELLILAVIIVMALVLVLIL